MKKQLIFFILLLFSLFLQAQKATVINPNTQYKGIVLTQTDTLVYKISLSQNEVYRFFIFQEEMAANFLLTDETGKKVREGYPSSLSGYQWFDYKAENSGYYTLSIKRFDYPQVPDSGKIGLLVKRFSAKEIIIRNKIQKELKSENAKTVSTTDVDNFWNAFDNLTLCKSYMDSVTSFQSLYLDKATDGMLDFIRLRGWTAEGFVDVVSKNADYYSAVRQRTFKVKATVPVIEEVFKKFEKIYPGFKTSKVCFAIGPKTAAGTVSDSYVLIGTELAVSGLTSDNEILQSIKGVIAHECVHIQQKNPDPTAISCPLLWQSIHEGSCDFIAELITEQPRKNEYGEKNETKLWIEFKNELCNQNFNNWLYNGGSIKNKPVDLGYFIGYAISKEYYKNTPDKSQAIYDIINMSDPIRFLEISKYDQKVKN